MISLTTISTKLSVLLAIFLTSFSSVAASTEPPKVAYLKGVEVLAKGTLPGQIRIAYQQACGESLRGLLINESKSLVLIGAVVDRAETFCLAMPSRREFVVPIRTGRPVASFPVRDSKRLLLSEVSDVTLSQGGFTISWQDTCRPMLGVVVTPISDGSGGPGLGINLASLSKESFKPASEGRCQKSLKRKLISGVKLPGEALQVTSKPGQLRDLYALRLVAPESVSLSSGRQVTVRWEKSCREEPIGVLFTGQDGRNVAILSALAPNAPCIGPSKAVVTYTINHLSISEGQSLTGISREQARRIGAEFKFSYRLQPVTSMKLARAGDASWLLASTASTCGRRLGLVIGQDLDGNLSMASLADGSSKICHVTSSSSSVTLTAPLVGPMEGPLPKVFSLKVFGTAVN